MGTMRAWGVAAVLVAGGLVTQATRAADDCNFATGATTFDYAQVMRCYRSLPFDAADLDNAVTFMAAARERSDLRDTYQAQFGWREELAALATRSFDSDFDLQMALVDNHKQFHNPHWRYRRPACYVDYLSAFMPFDFGSTVTRNRNGKQQQIVFIESAAYLPALYQDATGIDARRYVGLKVVSVNGVDAMDYFRAFGREVLRFDTNDGENFNEVLQNAAYSLRTSPTHDVPPDRAFDRYVLESTKGKRITVDMPWVFARRSAMGLGQRTLPASTAAFQATCLFRSQADQIAHSASGSASALTELMPEGRQASEQSFHRELREKRALAERLRKQEGESNGAGFFEVPPGQRNLAMTVVVAPSHGASAFAIDDKATILRLADFVQDWKQEVIAATDFACAHSDRLVLDMRNNNGGYTDQVDWLTSHLFPDRVEPQDYGLTGRYANHDAGRNELAARMQSFMQDFGVPGECWFGYEAACQVDPATGVRLSADDWYTQPSVPETRGGQTAYLTQRVAFSEDRPAYVAGSNPIACPGKFQGKTLAVLTNGTGASAGYFFPEMIHDQAVFVSAGGYVGEPLVSGIARGGAVWGMNDFEAANEQWFIAYVYGPAVDPLPYLRRNVDSFMEQPGLYVRNQPGQLHAELATRGDTWIDAWADSPDTDGYVYRKVLTALQAY